jgi:hypothetical protein
MTKVQKNVLQVEQRNRVINSFKNEIRFSDMRIEKQINNILYGIWEDEFEEESLLSF